MNVLERFLAICNFDEPDYYPIFGFPGAPGVSDGAMQKTHKRLVDTGMPEWVDGCHSLSKRDSVEKWQQYWGTTGPIYPDFYPAENTGKGIKSESRIKGDREIIEYETGAVTSQVIDNDVTYSMPEYKVYHVRDRKSWQFYRDRMTPGKRWSYKKIDEVCKPFDNRNKPLAIGAGGTWGGLRSLMGPEKASTILYDDPKLAHEIIDWATWKTEEYIFPLIERMHPEILQTGEDICFNNGMLISPKHFKQFCDPHYRKIGKIAHDCGVTMIAIDTDGNAMELVPLVEECGVNTIFPFEVKAGNDLFKIRKDHPQFIMMGWLEKEVLNKDKGHLIKNEIISKVPSLLTKGGYFPNADHGIQPLVTFENMCKFMTLLHEVTNNPKGEFPRIEM